MPEHARTGEERLLDHATDGEHGEAAVRDLLERVLVRVTDKPGEDQQGRRAPGPAALLSHGAAL